METSVTKVLNELCGALDQEIVAERSGRNRTGIPLADGRLLGQGGGNDLLYSFACFTDVNLPGEFSTAVGEECPLLRCASISARSLGFTRWYESSSKYSARVT
jgi:hypothetical protein